MSNTYAPFYLFVFLFTLTLTILCGRLTIPHLKKCAAQPIYKEGPEWHLSKSGTPTMGGISFISSIFISLLFSAFYLYLSKDEKGAASILICVIYALLNAMIGILDDVTKLRHKENAGLTPKAKIILQIVTSTLFLASRRIILNEKPDIIFFSNTLYLNIAYYLISLIILVGITNCANLTDGIDGLATSVAFAIGISLFYLSYSRYNTASFISASIIGAAVGFLVFNIHPAKVFMGDTGSLFLGALIAALAFEFKSPFIAVCSGGVYVIEGITVILQVAYFKLSKKRLFKMAPIHHHLEKCGWDESKICVLAIVLTLLFSFPSLLFI